MRIDIYSKEAHKRAEIIIETFSLKGQVAKGKVFPRIILDVPLKRDSFDMLNENCEKKFGCSAKTFDLGDEVKEFMVIPDISFYRSILQK